MKAAVQRFLGRQKGERECEDEKVAKCRERECGA
jgi:hypothetical protein